MLPPIILAGNEDIFKVLLAPFFLPFSEPSYNVIRINVNQFTVQPKQFKMKILHHSFRQPGWGILIFLILSFLNISLLVAQQGQMIPTDQTQKDFLKAYKTVFDLSDQDYRGSSITMDKVLFPKFGEYSIYWISSGTDQGSFIVPDTLPSRSASVTCKPYTNYNWQNAEHRSIQFKNVPKKIAVYRSKIETEGYSISWEAQYFKNLFETFLYKNAYYFMNEEDVTQNSISDSTELLVIPAFNVHKNGDKYYIDSIFNTYPQLKTNLQNFLAKGGTIYTEGNAAYFIEKIGYLATGAVNFNDKTDTKSNLLDLSMFATNNPIAFAHNGVKDQLYGSSIPKINAGSADIIATLKSDNRTVIFELTGSKANGGKIICNLGIPTVGGVSEVESGSRQLQWTLNTLLYAFSKKIDVTRSVYNIIPPTVIGGDNSVSYDRIDTFEIRVCIRNLSSEAISGISIQENLRKYFTYLRTTTSGVISSFSDGILTIRGISLAAKTEKIVTFEVSTPEPDNDVHAQVDKLIDYATFVAASINTTRYSDSEGNHSFNKKRDYADIMFSARIFGDADINWKNFLGLHWQPFKVFMIMENKERTQAENTVYTQYIPKDMPFYRTSDSKLDIPILKTPGGTFIDVLKGSDDKNNPEYDLDGDGDPDVWLDTTSIYPKGYKIKDTLVYWANPWKTTQAKLNGHDSIYYEDIDHDGNAGYRVNGVDYNLDNQDKIRAWKITWPVGTVKGYDYFDPYCSMEVWVDAPDMVAMAQGVAYASGKSNRKEGFYPYKTLDQAKASYDANGPWIHWMDKNTDGSVHWTGMYKQKMYNYQGYAFMDPASYTQKPWDTFYDTVPKPHEEFIAVISMGGEEIDMTHPTPSQSLYSKIDYKTIFNEQRVTPIRTTYSFYAPLPNPLQFEYLASTYSITDTLNNPLAVLPAKGKAKLRFDMDASTEYSYYWIRNAGHKVERQAPWIKDTVKNLGSGVFGYMIYEIPKGMGGYKITLPKKANGSYDVNAIVQVNGGNFEKWLTNKNTDDSIRIWDDDPFSYQVYIPQLLIPPALCDKNGDGIDDWIDDLGDRYKSNTGYLNDAFMPGIGESYPAGSPNVYTHVDDGITVLDGWSSGTDHTYGSDKFDELGRAHFTINALYEGKGKEGPVDISKGGTLVVEEIFGGSPWVIFSHVLTANAEGVDYKITSSASPASVKYGVDSSVFIKHIIEDANEPHEFNGNFDPYRASFGSTKAAVTSNAGGKDPCDWIAPNYATTTLIDPVKDHKSSITLIPGAVNNTALTKAGYPKNVSGTFLSVKVEVMNDDIDNGTSYEWLNTTVKPDLSKAGNSKVILSYVSYPRPLVPGDQPATDTTGWRFNQPEGEVLIQLGDTLKSRLQATRRAYFVYLISIDETLKKGIYTVGFTLSGDRRNYKGTSGGKLSLDVAPVKFSIVDKGNDNQPTAYQKFRIGEGSLKSLSLQGTEYFEGLNQVRWSTQDVDYTNFNSLQTSVPATYHKETGVEVIDLSKIGRLPNADSSQLYLLERVAVNSYRAGEDIDLTTGETLSYTYNNNLDTVPGNKVTVSPYGPKILISQKLYSVNGVPITDSLYLKSDDDVYIVTELSAINVGSDLSSNTMISIHPGPFYSVLVDSLPANVKFENGLINANLGALQPGESKFAYVYYKINNTITSKDDLMTVIKLSDIEYEGTSVKSTFKYTDPQKVLFEMYDFQLDNITKTQLAGRTFSITATATNRGLPATNVWFRIYPVIGDSGISEFPIKEMKIDNFEAGQTVELTVPSYTAPNGQRVQVVAKIDDGNKIKELLEQNNVQILSLADPLGVNDLRENFGVNVYPNPCADFVRFSYLLKDKAKDVQITIFNQNGSEVVKFIHCPSSAGTNNVDWTPKVSNGNYMYRISITEKDGTVSEIPGILIKTDK